MSENSGLVDALASCSAASWQGPHQDWSTVPPVLQAPITDLVVIAHYTGYVPKSQAPVSLCDFLSDIVGAPLEEYHPCLVDWIREHKSLAMIQDWFSSQGSNWHLYQEQLLTDTMPDGLELLLVCMLTRFHLNLLQDNHFWSTHVSGSQSSDPTVMLTECGLLFCDWFVDGMVLEVT